MTIYGWDMSHYDAPSIGAAVDQGVRFITHKAGGDAVDAELGDWWAGVRGLPVDEVLLGAYWVLYPGSPVSRADAFLARLDAGCPGWRDRPFILQVDCERWRNDPATVPGRADIAAFCDRLAARMPKLTPIVYAPEWVYGDSLDGLGYPLWASSYVNGTGGFRDLYPGDGSSRWGAYSGQVPTILQYTSKATIGGQTTCDANAYRGTLDELVALLAPGWSNDMPISDADVQRIAQAVWAADVIPVGSTRWAAGGTLGEIRDAMPARVRAAIAQDFAGVTRALTTLAARDDVDEQALAAALAPAVTSAVLAALPGGTDQVSQDEVTAAVVAAFRQAFSTPASTLDAPAS